MSMPSVTIAIRALRSNGKVLSALLQGENGRQTEIVDYLDRSPLEAAADWMPEGPSEQDEVAFNMELDELRVEVDLDCVGTGRRSPGTAYDPPDCDLEIVRDSILLVADDGRTLEILGALPEPARAHLIDIQWERVQFDWESGGE